MSWKELSEKLIQNVVGNLDLMSRHSFRCTNRQNRSIVDSTEFYIPRVKFSVTKSKYTIVYIEKIEKWTKIEISKEKGESTVVKFTIGSENKTIVSRSKQSTQLPCDEAVSILAKLFSQKCILIGTLEWDVCVEGENANLIQQRQEAVTKLIVKKFQEKTEKEHVFRVKTVCSISLSMDLDKNLKAMCDPEELKVFQKLIGEIPFQTNMITENYLPKYYRGIETHIYDLQLERPTLEILQKTYKTALKVSGAITLCFAKFDDDVEAIWDSIDAKIKMYDDKFVKCGTVQINGQLVITIHTLSPCGYWINAISQEELNRMGVELFEEYVKSTKCGLGHLCKKCADPIDFWYFQNFNKWNSKSSGEADDVTKKIWKLIPYEAKLYSICVSVSKELKTTYTYLDSLAATAQKTPGRKTSEISTEIKQATEMLKKTDALSPLSQKRGKSIVGAILREKVFENVPLNSTVIYPNSDSFFDCFGQNIRNV